MTPSQCRAARGILRWTQDDLASAADVSDETVRNFETELATPRQAGLDEMRLALEAAGVIFITEDRQGPGVAVRETNWPLQCRAARGLLGWTQSDLAAASSVSNLTVSKTESGQVTPNRSSLRKMRSALEKAGVIFVNEIGETGARLRKGLR